VELKIIFDLSPAEINAMPEGMVKMFCDRLDKGWKTKLLLAGFKAL